MAALTEEDVKAVCMHRLQWLEDSWELNHQPLLDPCLSASHHRSLLLQKSTEYWFKTHCFEEDRMLHCLSESQFRPATNDCTDFP